MTEKQCLALECASTNSIKTDLKPGLSRFSPFIYIYDFKLRRPGFNVNLAELNLEFWPHFTTLPLIYFSRTSHTLRFSVLELLLNLS